jgi:hypothetical protein
MGRLSLHLANGPVEQAAGASARCWCHQDPSAGSDELRGHSGRREPAVGGCTARGRRHDLAQIVVALSVRHEILRTLAELLLAHQPKGLG